MGLADGGDAPIALYLDADTKKTHGEIIASGVGFLHPGLSLGLILSRNKTLEVMADSQTVLVGEVGPEPVKISYTEYDALGERMLKVIIALVQIQQTGEVFVRQNLFTDTMEETGRSSSVWIELSYGLAGSSPHSPVRVAWSCYRSWWEANRATNT